MVPEGLTLTLYEKEHWRGWHQIREGQAYHGEKGSRGLVCQKIYDKPGYFHSLKIEREKQGKIVGYWKGITASEAQQFTYTVGLKSSDAKLTKTQKQEKINRSFSQGFSASATVSGDVGIVSGSASLKLEGKYKRDKDTENTIKQELSTTAESN